MEVLGSLLPKALQQHVARGNQAVLQVLTPLWPRILGKHIGRFSRPAAFSDGMLTVCASSRTWAAQLNGFSEQIRAQINSALGAPVVTKLRVREDRAFCEEPGRMLDSRKRPDPATAGAAKSRLRTDLGSLLGAENGVKLPPDLAEILERSFVKYFSRTRDGTNA